MQCLSTWYPTPALPDPCRSPRTLLQPQHHLHQPLRHQGTTAQEGAAQLLPSPRQAAHQAAQGRCRKTPHTRTSLPGELWQVQPLLRAQSLRNPSQRVQPIKKLRSGLLRHAKKRLRFLGCQDRQVQPLPQKKLSAIKQLYWLLAIFFSILSAYRHL